MQNQIHSKGIVVNIDLASYVYPFLDSVLKDEKVTKESLYPFVDQYKELPGSQITTLAINIFGQHSDVDSEVWEDYYSISKRKTENGVAVDYEEQYRPLVRWNKEYGIDPYAVWFARTRELGMEAWMSIRMNDCHCPDETASWIRSDFFYEAREKGWMVGDHYGYHRHCFDYTVPKVREKMLAYIEEQLGRYDVDALEMDFIREIYCFDYINCPDKVEIMNDFIRNVKKIVDAASLRWNHKIKLTARLMRDIEQNLVYGFDVETWAQEGLVDHITVSPRWASCDDAMPIAEWKTRFPDIEISAGIELLVRIEDNGYEKDGITTCAQIDADGINGLAANYISQGADEIYLFNYYLNPRKCEKIYVERSLDIFTRCGVADTVFETPRRHIVMNQDIAPEGCERYKPLPLTLTDAEKSVTVYTGMIPDGKDAKLIVGFLKGTPETTGITVNGIPYTTFRPTKISSIVERHGGKMHRITVEENAYAREGVTFWECDIMAEQTSGVQTVSFQSENACVDYIEIVVQ